MIINLEVHKLIRAGWDKSGYHPNLVQPTVIFMYTCTGVNLLNNGPTALYPIRRTVTVMHENEFSLKSQVQMKKLKVCKKDKNAEKWIENI